MQHTLIKYRVTPPATISATMKIYKQKVEKKWDPRNPKFVSHF